MLDHADETLETMTPPPFEDLSGLDADALRQRVRDYVAANSTSYSGVALIAGIAESTFTAWLGGKYKGNNARIEEQVRIWLQSESALGKKRLVMPADAKFAMTRSAQKFMAVLEHAQGVPDIGVITAGAGVGKTTVFEHYKATRPNVWILTAEPSIASPYAMLQYLREVVGIPEAAPHRISRAITTKLIDSQGLIIIDEAQHLAIKCIDQLRSIYDRANIGVVFAGNLEVWSRIDGGGRKAEFAQLFSRVGMRVTVNRPSDKDIEIMLDALSIYADDQRKILKFIATKPGALRAMVKTLRVARMLAIGAGEGLAKEHISSAWSRLSGGEAGVA